MTASVAELTDGMSLEQRAALASRIRAQAARLRTIRECPTPLDLACRYDPTMVRTPALEMVAVRLVETIRARDGRLVISIPPQQGKARCSGGPSPGRSSTTQTGASSTRLTAPVWPASQAGLFAA